MVLKTSYLANHVRNLKPSGIRKFFDATAGMTDVISLGVGEPDFVTPWNVREAAILSLEDGHTSYTANAGLLELREAIAKYVDDYYCVAYDPEHEITVTVGASEAIDIALRAILDPGDEVLVVEPCFVSYAPLVTLAGGTPVIVAAEKENDFKVQARQLEDAVTERTKAIMICSPNNPTGSMLSKQEMEQVARVAKKHDLLILSDEIYAELVYDDLYTSFAAIDGMRERTILVSGFSKDMAMTGWRLGFVCAPAEITQGMLKIHQYAIMCASTMAQYAALEGLRNGRSDMAEMRKSYRLRRNFVVESLNEMGLACYKPEGAFYTFPNIELTGMDSESFATRLLHEERVVVVPGNAFGDSGEGYVRCSYATSMGQLREAMKRIHHFVDNL
ncbi:aminotransferase [Sporolactobacillus inulinus]|jgi:aminotransferase|uniref:Aminotransferase n=2 Tax=Sporolactobacillus inulinus TaxID=2078 RepID=A0A0U1QSN5_9BACL|nr:aminotransferase [Sporolactobacillus inulinus]KLI03811.1 aromatic amino acid aminotransferase [Sporolactobacillus inulinus CASD]GEB76109.1 aminotransferase [Sporolactobacillus inulinus]